MLSTGVSIGQPLTSRLFKQLAVQMWCGLFLNYFGQPVSFVLMTLTYILAALNSSFAVKLYRKFINNVSIKDALHNKHATTQPREISSSFSDEHWSTASCFMPASTSCSNIRMCTIQVSQKTSMKKLSSADEWEGRHLRSVIDTDITLRSSHSTLPVTISLSRCLHGWYPHKLLARNHY